MRVATNFRVSCNKSHNKNKNNPNWKTNGERSVEKRGGKREANIRINTTTKHFYHGKKPEQQTGNKSHNKRKNNPTKKRTVKNEVLEVTS